MLALHEGVKLRAAEPYLNYLLSDNLSVACSRDSSLCHVYIDHSLPRNSLLVNRIAEKYECRSNSFNFKRRISFSAHVTSDSNTSFRLPAATRDEVARLSDWLFPRRVKSGGRAPFRPVDLVNTLCLPPGSDMELMELSEFLAEAV